MPNSKYNKSVYTQGVLGQEPTVWKELCAINSWECDSVQDSSYSWIAYTSWKLLRSIIKKHNKQVQKITKEINIAIFFILHRYER